MSVLACEINACLCKTSACDFFNIEFWGKGGCNNNFAKKMPRGFFSQTPVGPQVEDRANKMQQNFKPMKNLLDVVCADCANKPPIRGAEEIQLLPREHAPAVSEVFTGMEGRELIPGGILANHAG